MSAGEFVSAAREPYRRLLGYLKPYRKRFVLGLLAGAVYGVLNGLMVAAVHHVGSEVLPKEEPAGRHGATLAEDWNAEIELPEVRAAVEAVQIPSEGGRGVRALNAAEQQSAVQSYQDFRAQIAARRLRGKPAGGVDPLAVQPIDPLLPAEFRLVLEGERAMLTGAPEAAAPAVGLVERLRSGVATVFRRDLQPAHLAQARASWQQLLNLPEAERRHRTLWARYLLAQTESDKRSRVAQIEAMRSEVASGKFTDVLNLKEAAPPPKSLLSVVLLCAMIPGLMLVRAVFGWFNTYCLTWVSLRVLDDIRGNLFSRVLSQVDALSRAHRALDLWGPAADDSESDEGSAAGAHECGRGGGQGTDFDHQCAAGAVSDRLEVHPDEFRAVSAVHHSGGSGGSEGAQGGG